MLSVCKVKCLEILFFVIHSACKYYSIIIIPTSFYNSFHLLFFVLYFTSSIFLWYFLNTNFNLDIPIPSTSQLSAKNIEFTRLFIGKCPFLSFEFRYTASTKCKFTTITIPHYSPTNLFSINSEPKVKPYCAKIPTNQF